VSADSALLGPRPGVAEPVPPPPRRLAIGASAALAGQLSTVAGSIVTSIFLAQTFGPEGTGTYALVGNLFAAVLLLAALGLPTGITFLVSRGAWPARRALQQSLAAALPMGLAGMALGFAFYVWTKHSVLKGVSVGEALAVTAAVPFGLAWLFCSAIAIGCDLYERIATFQLSRAALTIVAVIGPGIAFGLSGAIVGFAVAQVLSAAAAAASLVRFNRRESRHPASGANRRETIRPLRAAFGFGRRAWSADVLQFLNYRLDLFILAAYVARADVGRYSLAVSLTMVAWLLPSAIGQVLLPRTASLDSASAAGDVSRASADGAVARVIRHTVLLQLPTGAAVIVLLVVGIPLVYGPPFRDSIVLGLLLLPGVLAASIAKVVSPVITGRGFPIYSVYNVLITVPVTVALYLLLIPTLGATGAALASTASYTLTTVLAMYFYRRVTNGSMRAALVPTRADLREYRVAVAHLLSSGRARLHRCASS
jgi:O-antigen/teichoic acid export membrane protein